VKILIIDKTPISLAWAMKCLAAGHQVRLFFSPSSKDLRTGEGIVPRVKDWRPSMRWADLIFMSDNSYAQEDLETFFRKGFPIFGCNRQASQWELQRDKGQSVFQQAGIPSIGGTIFHSYEEAERHVATLPARYVSKPNGDLAKDLSYVSRGPADMIYMLRRWKKTGKVQKEFILQPFVKGIEMGVGGWFGPDGWSSQVCENWEFKKLCNGDLGVSTGEMGTVLRYTRKSLLAEQVLFPLTDFLLALGYLGYCDVNCIIDAKGNPWPLEFTMRLGWPLFHIQGELHGGDPAEWMLDKHNGRDTLQILPGVALGVVMALPDFPYGNRPVEEVSGIPLYGLTARNLPHISLCSVRDGTAPALRKGQIVEEEMPVSAGDYLCVCHGTGERVTEAKDAAYQVVKSLEIPNSVIYRTDIGDRLKDQLPILRRMGYAKGLLY